MHLSRASRIAVSPCTLGSLDGASSLLVGVRAALRAALHDAHETAVERHALLGAACEDLLLLRLRDLRRLVLHLTGARQGSVHLAHGFERVLALS